MQTPNIIASSATQPSSGRAHLPASISPGPAVRSRRSSESAPAAVPSLARSLFRLPRVSGEAAPVRRHHTFHSPRTEGEGDGPGAFGAAAAAGGGAERAVERAAIRAERGRAGAEAAGARHH